VKRYPAVTAVDGLSFQVPPGMCFGLLGPNGAGKTTTMEIMEGILAPSAGSVSYRGEALGERFREEAGILFQATALQHFLTVRQSLALFADCMPADGTSTNCCACARSRRSPGATIASSPAASASGCCSPSRW
ncbi:ABC-type transporter, ATP-binding protein, partial [mine drainage metagenome]